MLILAIETSCDDTCVSVLDIDEAREGLEVEVLSNVVSSQVEIHKKYGGIVPNLASREHVSNIVPVLNRALDASGLEQAEWKKRLDLITATRGPGLIPSLLVGTSFAKGLSWKLQIPALGVNHLEGHLYSGFFERERSFENSLPALCLIVSGGHTQLVLIKKPSDYKLLGQTLDDAAGEAFDKVARHLDLGYPGGPIIEKRAQKGDPEAFDLPSPMIDSGDFNFSFSGLKTAVLRRTEARSLSTGLVNDVAASFQHAAVKVLVEKTITAVTEHREVKTVLMSGGVASNDYLRNFLSARVKDELSGVDFLAPSKRFCTDNAAMIGLAGYMDWKEGNFSDFSDGGWKKLEPDPSLNFEQ